MEIKEYLLGIAIFILTLFVVIYGINTFYSNPDYDDFCGQEKQVSPGRYNTSQTCIDAGGKWNSYDFPESKTEGYCDLTYSCRQEYDEEKKKHDFFVFIASIPLGILIILVGMFLFKLDSIGFGLMAGGAATFVYGAGTYWRHGDDLFKFLISLLGLIALIFMAYWFDKRFVRKDKSKGKKKR